MRHWTFSESLMAGIVGLTLSHCLSGSFILGIFIPAFYCLTRRRHDMGNSLGDKTSCESSTPLTYSTLNVLAPNGQ